MIDNWDDLKPLLSEEWVTCMAWAVGGGDPEHLEIRVQGGRSKYTNAWCVYGSKDRDWVRLSRIVPGDEAGPREIVRWVRPEALVEVHRPLSAKGLPT